MTINEISELKFNLLAPNQLIIYNGDKTILTSYGSIIAIRTDSGDTYLGADWKYSTTTSKYRNKFLGESTAETQAKLSSGEYRLL